LVMGEKVINEKVKGPSTIATNVNTSNITELNDSMTKFCDKIKEINADNQEEFINKFMRRIFSDDQLQSLLYSLKLN
jgi:hypothetical protein